MSTVFDKIIQGEIQADILYKDDLITAFRDMQPAAPVHILIVPNRIIPTVNDLTEGDEGLVGHMVMVARKIAHDEGIAENGYRLVINCNAHAGQEVFHLHLHLLGGRPLGPIVQPR